jgi:uncharacterized short protein YbdD (DUF466 family)
VTALARVARSVRWYVRELLGDAAYDHYLARHAREHPGHTPLSHRDFYRTRRPPTAGGCC